MVAELGWRIVPHHARVLAWANAALPLAITSLATDAQPKRCGGTWAVGLDLLENDALGGVGDVPLPWDVLGLSPEPVHKAQLSTIYPGYPQASAEETAAAFEFRKNRDAAHLDGLLPLGPQKQRYIKEPHAWILGIALNACSADASPLVVWEGSHIIMKAALDAYLQGFVPESWNDVDVTHAYKVARAKVFATCKRRELPISPGQATVLHRHLVHGVAPWATQASAPEQGRIIAYFRPLLPSVQSWLQGQ
jgi:hypothetical protein